MKEIVSAKIGPMPTSIFGPMPSVTVTYDDDSTEQLFTFYPDEINFTESEFVGKTRNGAMALRHRRDVAFLQA